MKQIKYTWQNFEKDVDKLVNMIKSYKEIGSIKEVYGIPRGGLILATLLSHKLNIPLIIHETKIKRTTLIVDDISDTGKTFEKLANKLGIRYSNLFTSLWIMEDTKFTPQFYLRIKNKDQWTVFPWETKETTK